MKPSPKKLDSAKSVVNSRGLKLTAKERRLKYRILINKSEAKKYNS